MQWAINTTPFQLSEQNEKKHYTCPAFPWCVRTLLHTHTTMPTCLSIRFYHHRDTVDSSFVRLEKIGALRSQTTTFIAIYKGCEYASVCVFLCSHTQRKGQGCELLVEQKSLCVCISMWESVHSFLPAFAPVFWWSWLCESCLTHWGQWVLSFRKIKRSNINTEPLCYQQSRPVRQRAPPSRQEWTGFQNTGCQGGWMNGWKCQPFRDSRIFRLAIHF